MSLSDFKSTWDDSFEKHPTLLMQSSVPCQQAAVEESTCYSWYFQQNLTNWGKVGHIDFMFKEGLCADLTNNF